MNKSNRASKQKLNYSALTLEQAMQLIGRDSLLAWQLNAPPRPPSATLLEIFRRFESFTCKARNLPKLC